MPAKRLSWFKVWIDATTHAKVRKLDDGTFRTWVEMLDAAAQQKERGRFANRKEAVAITRRPAKHMTTLIGAGLVDEDSSDGHLTMHDWDEWQRWRPEDSNDTGSPPDHPPNDSRTTRERLRNGHMNGTGLTHEELTNDPAIRAGAAVPASGEERGEKREEELKPPVPSGQPPQLRVVGEPVPKPKASPTLVGMLIDRIRALDPEVAVFGDQGFTGRKLKENPETDLDLVAEAYVSFHHGEWPGSKMLRESGALAWVIGDLGGYVTWRNGQQRRKPGQLTREQAEAEFGWHTRKSS